MSSWIKPEDRPPPCCDSMEKAQEHGTDNEGYGSLLHFYERTGWSIGCDLPSPVHCPWCGEKLPVPEEAPDE